MMKKMIFSKGDIDAGFGVFFDGFSKIIIGTTVLINTINIPSSFVFGKIISAIGLTALIFMIWTTFFARKTGERTKNPSMTALPGGIGSASFFIWLYGIMLPTFLATNDYLFAWKVALWANVFHSVILIVCSFFIKWLLKLIPGAAIFSSLAGGAMAWLVISAFADGFNFPTIFLPALFILLTIYFGKIQIKGLSPAIFAILFATLIAWIGKYMNIEDVKNSFHSIGFYLPKPSFSFISKEAFNYGLKYIPIVIAFAFSDMIASIQALEQAEAGGDIYDTKIALLSTGATNILGAILGNPFIFCFYWGHPAWKKAKAGENYMSLVGIVYFLLCMTGLVAIATAALPSAATIVLIVYAGINSIGQAFETNHQKYYPAMALGVAIPIFELIYGKIQNAMDVTKTTIMNEFSSEVGNMSLSEIIISKSDLNSAGISQGYELLGQGSVLIAIIYVSALCFIIDRKWIGASLSFLVATVASGIGLIHSAQVGLNLNSSFVMIYFIFSIAFLLLHFLSKKTKI